MDRFVFGGNINYGQIAGILMLDSTIPRLAGDPGHAETFSFAVRLCGWQLTQDRAVLNY